MFLLRYSSYTDRKMKTAICCVMMTVGLTSCVVPFVFLGRVLWSPSIPTTAAERKDESAPLFDARKKLLAENCTVHTGIGSLCVGSDDTGHRTEPLCSLKELSQDCELLRTVHLYDDKPVDKEETQFPLAFGLKMHTYPEQAEQLLRAIYRPHNVYCIHVDGNADDDAVFRVMASLAACFPNVMMTDRVKIVYAGYSVVEAELLLMKCTLNSSVGWKYYLNLAGQEFPLKTNLEMVRMLGLLNGSNGIASYPMPRHHMSRVKYRYEARGGKTTKTSFRKDPPPFKAEVRKGSQYAAFSRAFVTSLLSNRTLLDVVDYYNDTYSPDETLWATLNALPGVAGGYPGSCMMQLSRAVLWQNYKPYRCKGQYVRSVCVFARDDLPWLLRQPNMIANKFKKEKDSLVLSCLEAVIGQRARSRGVTVDQTYIANLPNMKARHRGKKLTPALLEEKRYKWGDK